MPALELRGYLPDTTSPRYAKLVHSSFDKLAPQLPAPTGTVTSEYRIPELLPCFNQMAWGSCVLNAWVGCLEILRGLESGTAQSLSRAWAYALCELEMGSFNKDTGTFPFLAADRLMQIGTVPEASFPYTASNLPALASSPAGFMQTHPSASLYIEASDNKITGAFKIDAVGSARCDAVEQAIRANHPVVWAAGYDVQALTNWDLGDPALMPPAAGVKTEGHSTLLTGVCRLATGVRWFRVRNSWDIDWGDNGYFWVTDNYVASNIAADFWVGTRMQGLVI
jgi:hypothetical protein